MKGMILTHPGKSLSFEEIAKPVPLEGQILIKVTACGVCRTDLHVIDGELSHPILPLILGHEIVGTVEAIGDAVRDFEIGQRVGVPWLGETCGECKYCLIGKENLCDNAIFTGYTRNGGYANYTVANSNYCFPIVSELSDEHVAPLLCAGLIGWRTLKLAGKGKRLGIYGFGAAAHITAQIAMHLGWDVYAFTRSGNTKGQDFARKLGAIWAGASDELPPERLDAALIFAPAGKLLPLALAASDKGATIVCGGIHMSDIPSFPYSALWEERTIKSVANLTRNDAFEFFEILKEIQIKTSISVYDLKDANQALSDLRNSRFEGAAVLRCNQATNA